MTPRVRRSSFFLSFLQELVDSRSDNFQLGGTWDGQHFDEPWQGRVWKDVEAAVRMEKPAAPGEQTFLLACQVATDAAQVGTRVGSVSRIEQLMRSADGNPSTSWL
jgi:hypothetical protein